MISFDNTEVAFQSKTNYDLSKAWWLFKLIGNNMLVKWSKPLSSVAITIGGPFKYLIKETIYEHFCGGESIRECESTIEKLGKYHVYTILDYSVEGKDSEEDFERTANEIMATQERAALDDLVPFNVFKLTGLARFALLEKVSSGKPLTEAENHEFARVKERVEKLCRQAAEIDRCLMMDAEESWIQPVMDELMLEMMRKYNREKALIFNTFQMYRHDRLQVLKDLIELSQKEGFYVGVKIVRGAYMEKERERASEKGYPSPIQPDKASSDRDYNLALEVVIKHIDRMALVAGTHNEASSQYLTELMSNNSIEPADKRIYFSQLLGMSDHISFNLAHAGFNVVKYVPFGPVKDVLPYLIRRAEENTSVAGQTGRELNLLSKERARRKSKKR